MERVLDLIGRVYDAALDEKQWPALAPAIAGAFESNSTAVFTVGAESVRYLSATGNQDQALAREYQDYYHRLDLWVSGGMKYGAGTIVTSQQILSDSEFAATEFYQDFVRRMDVLHLIGSVVPVSNGETGVPGIHRPRASGAYEQEDRALAALFLPHLQRALQLRRRLAEAGVPTGAALDALERNGTAIIVVTREGRVLYANREAERLMRARGLP